MWKLGYRDEIWSRLDQGFDVIVVGGGITGAGILAEAARAGMRALLVEARDFASGTSSRSTKLVHGGLRYLRQGQFRVTRESVLERERLMREAHGLVTPLGFYLTSFKNDAMPGWMFGAGLAIYDLIARKWAHEHHPASELVEKIPALAGAPLKGGYHYFDAQTDDARLVMRVLKEAVRHGGTALNYARVEGLMRDGNGQVVGAIIRDSSNGKSRTIEVKAKVVINATGAWADDLRHEVGAKKKLRAIRGSHLVFSRDRFPVAEAVSLMHPRDARAVFALPWEGVTVFGTTDVDHPESLETEPRISSSEVEYLLEIAKHAFPNLDLKGSDVRSTFAGVRGVIDTGAKNPAKESREHALWNEHGLLTVSGGKLTTFRLMALEALEKAAPMLGLKKGPKRGRILTEPTDMLEDDSVDPGLRARLVGRHGTDARDVLGTAAEDRTCIGDSPASWGELRHAARTEGIVHLDDLLLRRLRLGLLLPEGGMRELETIKRIAQPELGWDDAKWSSEVDAYRATWNRCYGTSLGS